MFQKENGTVTAGNASGLNDGAGAVILMNASVAAKRGVKPLARLVAYAHAGVDPNIMGIGPVPATQAALKRAGLTVDQLDVIEANEAFAAQACAVSRELKLDPAKVNPNGSGIGLGHPSRHRRHGRCRCAGDHVHRRRPGASPRSSNASEPPLRTNR